MNKMLGVMLVGFILSGCVLPPALVTLSYMKTGADVVSYAITKKGTTDHVISAYMDKDCALHRVVTDGEICKLTQKQILEQLVNDYENDRLNVY